MDDKLFRYIKFSHGYILSNIQSGVSSAKVSTSNSGLFSQVNCHNDFIHHIKFRLLSHIKIAIANTLWFNSANHQGR